MGRILTIQRAMVPRTERDRYLDRLRERQAAYVLADCRFWVFEEIGLPGLFMEFTEASDEATLRAAHATISDKMRDPSRMYQQVELT